MVKIYVNNKLTYVPYNSSVLEACKSVGIDVPRFCFHERLSVAGNCRMCLVELEKSPKPVASCAMPVVNNMRVFTDTPLVRKARESVLEFLLVNHPLDCPICDQAGECDLQDQTMVFGSDRNRFFAFKRSVEDKNCGPLVKTIMNRCIHCTRCVRFITDIAGIEDLGTTNRGRSTEIGTYLQKALKSELSGNIVDLCPVGALTSKPYAFIARPWELRSVESIDFSDAVGSNIRIDFKETELVRILPKKNEGLNEEWLSDKARYCFDGSKIQRLDRPYIKDAKGALTECSWETAINSVSSLFSKVKASEVSIIVSPDLGISSLIEVENFASSSGIQNIGFPRKLEVNSDFVENFIVNTPLDDINLSDFCLFVGCNPRFEAAMFNLKLRKRSQLRTFDCFSIGLAHDLTYKSKILGISPEILLEVAEGRHPVCKLLRSSKKPLVVFSASLAERIDFRGLEQIIRVLSKYTRVVSSEAIGYCFLNQESNQVGLFNIGLKRINTLRLKNHKLCLLIGYFKEEDLKILRAGFNPQLQLIVISANGNILFKNSSVVLPLKGVFEHEDIYFNLEGTPQKSLKAVSIESSSKDVFEILLLMRYLYIDNSFQDLNRENLENYLMVSKKDPKFFSLCLEKKSNLESFNISKYPFFPYVTDFYTTGSLAEFSMIMAKCSSFYRSRFSNFIADL